MMSKAVIACLAFGMAYANPHYQYQSMQQTHQASDRQGLGVSGDLNIGIPSALQHSNPLMTVVVGLGIVSFLNIVVTALSPLFKTTNSTTSANSTTPAGNSTANKTESARSARYELLDLADKVLMAVEALGKNFDEKEE